MPGFVAKAKLVEVTTPAPVDKKKIFVFFGTAEINELLCFSLDSRYHSETSGFSSSTQVVPAVKAKKFDLAVIDFSLDEGMVVLELALAEKIPVVLYHPEGKSPELRGPKRKVFKEDGLLAGIDEGLRQIAAAPAITGGDDPDAAYLPVSVPLFLRVNPIPADTFVKLSGSRFVKVFHKGATFTAEDRKKYFDDKKISNFFLRRDEAPSMHAQLNQMLAKMIKSMPRLVKEVPKPTPEQAVAVIHDLARNLGFTPEVQKLVKANMDVVMKEMQESPSLAGVLSNMERNKDKYITAHSQLLAEVSCALAIAMEWGSDTSLKKITMASLLHDMCLTDQKLCAVKDVTELEKRRDEFSLEEMEEYKSHPKRAALLIQGMKEVPADVDKIVYQHHELPKGTGFPAAVSHVHIHPLAATLMVAHDLVDWVLDHAGPPDMAAFSETYREKYSVGAFKKIMKVLETFKF